MSEHALYEGRGHDHGVVEGYALLLECCNFTLSSIALCSLPLQVRIEVKPKGVVRAEYAVHGIQVSSGWHCMQNSACS